MRTLTAVVAAMLASAWLYGQEAPRRVTVLTAKGDTVEGTLRSASLTEISVEIAGQPLTIRVADIKYISFDGKIEAATTNAKTATPTPPIEAALTSLRALRSVIQVGVLREQYNAKLLEHVPAITAFTSSPTTDWNDLKQAMSIAVANFKEPMDSLSAWKSASTTFGYAGLWADHALKLAGLPGEQTHRESDAKRPIQSSGPTVTGRLGYGDMLMPADLDRGSLNAYNDIYTFTIPPGNNQLYLGMICRPCRPHLTLVGPGGKRVAADAALTKATIQQRNLPAGNYEVWAGASGAIEIGEYELAVTLTAK